MIPSHKKQIFRLIENHENLQNSFRKRGQKPKNWHAELRSLKETQEQPENHPQSHENHSQDAPGTGACGSLIRRGPPVPPPQSIPPYKRPSLLRSACRDPPRPTGPPSPLGPSGLQTSSVLRSAFRHPPRPPPRASIVDSRNSVTPSP